MAPIHYQKDSLLPLSEKSSFDSLPHVYRHAQSEQKSRMTSARKLCIALLVGGLVVVGLAHSESAPENVCSTEQGETCIDVASQHDQSALSRIIQSASPEALHNFLHSVTGFQHGVFDSDIAAAEAVLKIDPSLSTSVAQLQRRQQNGTSTSDSVLPPNSPTTASTTSEATTPATTPGITTTPITTPAQTTTTPATTAPSTQDTTTPTATTPTTTTAASTTVATTASSSTQETTQKTSADTSNTVPSGTTTTQPATTTTNGDQTTSTRKPSTSLKTNIVTSTLPGGALTTMTTVAVITADGSTDTQPTTSSNPSLQNGRAGHSYSKSLVEVIIGAVAVGGAMLL